MSPYSLAQRVMTVRGSRLASGILPIKKWGLGPGGRCMRLHSADDRSVSQQLMMSSQLRRQHASNFLGPVSSALVHVAGRQNEGTSTPTVRDFRSERGKL